MPCGVAVFGCGKGAFPDMMLLMCTIVIWIAGAFLAWELFEESSLPWFCPLQSIDLLLTYLEASNVVASWFPMVESL